MKGKEGSGDPEGREAKSGLALSGRGLDTSGEKGFFADVVLSVWFWGDGFGCMALGEWFGFGRMVWLWAYGFGPIVWTYNLGAQPCKRGQAKLNSIYAY